MTNFSFKNMTLKLEWPFTVMNAKHKYATIILYQFADMPQKSGGCIILENGNCSLPLILRKLQSKPKIRSTFYSVHLYPFLP